MMRRREFLGFVAGATVLWPLSARAQTPAMPVVGFLSSLSPLELTFSCPRCTRASTRLVLSRVVTSQSNTVGQKAITSVLADDLVRRQVAVIAAISGTPAALAAKAATTTIPIVFAIGGDPVTSDLVASLNRPGGNITGVTFLTTTIVAKRLEMLRALVPTAIVIAFLVNPNNPIAEAETKSAEGGGRTLGLQMHVLN